MPVRLRQILWFIGLWLAGIVALSVVAYGIRAMIM
ncbi:DUF2474 family protein [Aureimonas frigidaquae]|nr:DUF2474 family protein [Aureimonas frigidaquae]